MVVLPNANPGSDDDDEERDSFGGSRFTPSRGGFGLQRGPEDDAEDEDEDVPAPVFPSRY